MIMYTYIIYIRRIRRSERASSSPILDPTQEIIIIVFSQTFSPPDTFFLSGKKFDFSLFLLDQLAAL